MCDIFLHLHLFFFFILPFKNIHIYNKCEAGSRKKKKDYSDLHFCFADFSALSSQLDLFTTEYEHRVCVCLSARFLKTDEGVHYGIISVFRPQTESETDCGMYKYSQKLRDNAAL